jgi:hypothetical protein
MAIVTIFLDASSTDFCYCAYALISKEVVQFAKHLEEWLRDARKMHKTIYSKNRSRCQYPSKLGFFIPKRLVLRKTTVIVEHNRRNAVITVLFSGMDYHIETIEKRFHVCSLTI